MGGGWPGGTVGGAVGGSGCCSGGAAKGLVGGVCCQQMLKGDGELMPGDAGWSIPDNLTSKLLEISLGNTNWAQLAQGGPVACGIKECSGNGEQLPKDERSILLVPEFREQCILIGSKNLRVKGLGEHGKVACASEEVLEKKPIAFQELKEPLVIWRWGGDRWLCFPFIKATKAEAFTSILINSISEPAEGCNSLPIPFHGNAWPKPVVPAKVKVINAK